MQANVSFEWPLWISIFRQTALLVVLKSLPLFRYLQLLQMFTDFYNIWQTVCFFNLQHNGYWFTDITYLLLLHYLGIKAND